MPMTSTSTPTRAKERIDAGDVQLVDVREPYEWDAGRIAGARHIELERLASEAGSLDRDRPVLFYCRLGARSGMAANAFRRAGYDAYSDRRRPDRVAQPRAAARARRRHGRRALMRAARVAALLCALPAARRGRRRGSSRSAASTRRSHVTAPPGDPARLFVVEQRRRRAAARRRRALQAAPFADLSRR